MPVGSSSAGLSSPPGKNAHGSGFSVGEDVTGALVDLSVSAGVPGESVGNFVAPFGVGVAVTGVGAFVASFAMGADVTGSSVGTGITGAGVGASHMNAAR